MILVRLYGAVYAGWVPDGWWGGYLYRRTGCQRRQSGSLWAGI